MLRSVVALKIVRAEEQACLWWDCCIGWMRKILTPEDELLVRWVCCVKWDGCEGAFLQTEDATERSNGIHQMYDACLFYFHCEIFLVIDVFVGACVAKEDTGWCMFLVYFISPAAVFAYNESAPKHTKVTKVGAASCVAFKPCHGAR